MKDEETRDGGRETKRRTTRDERRETGEKGEGRWETGDERRETGDGRWRDGRRGDGETGRRGDERRETGKWTDHPLSPVCGCNNPRQLVP